MLAPIHTDDGCTGNWIIEGSDEERIIRCSGCGALAVASLEHRVEAVDENICGHMLRRLADDGATILAVERGL